MKLLPYVDKELADYKDKSVQEFCFAISEGIREQIFFTGFVQNTDKVSICDKCYKTGI